MNRCFHSCQQKSPLAGCNLQEILINSTPFNFSKLVKKLLEKGLYFGTLVTYDLKFVKMMISVDIT